MQPTIKPSCVYLVVAVALAALLAADLPGAARPTKVGTTVAVDEPMSKGRAVAAREPAPHKAASSARLSPFDQPGSTRHLPLRAWDPQVSCRIDPQTGCHYGHDEESHPGGCRCGAP